MLVPNGIQHWQGGRKNLHYFNFTFLIEALGFFLKLMEVGKGKSIEITALNIGG